MLEWIVPFEESGIKLIHFLTNHLKDQYSARFLKQALEQNRCQINGKTERFASRVVGKGDHVVLNLKGFTKPTSHNTSFDPSRLLYEDNLFIIYNKPAGVISDEKGILHAIKTYFPAARLLHRLDRGTTGVLLFVKTQEAFEQMVQQFKQFAVEKCYLAIVDGRVEKKRGTIENYLGKKHHYEGQTIWGEVSEQKGLYARTDWLKLQEGHDASLLQCHPKTGRTHQLRVHLAGMGHPILGDFQYCKQFRCSYRPERYLLHAYEVRFSHPMTGQPMHIKAPIPRDFAYAQHHLFKHP